MMLPSLLSCEVSFTKYSISYTNQALTSVLLWSKTYVHSYTPYITLSPHSLVYGDQNEQKLLTQKINCLFYKVSLLTDLKSLQIKQGKKVIMGYQPRTNIYRVT